MTHRLDLIFVKIERAEEHLLDLDTTVAAFLAGPTPPYEIATKTNAQTEEFVYYVGSIRDIPLKLAAITGDALQNLRSALDHLAYQLVLAGGGTPTIQTAFPISDSATKHMSAQFRGKVKGMRQDAIHAIDAVKP